MRCISRLIVVTTCVALAGPSLAVAADEEMVANPPYQHWSAFKVGSTVTQKEKVKFAKNSDEAEYYPGGVHEKDLTYKLLEVTPEKVVVELTVTDYGVGQTTEMAPSKVTFPAKVRKGHSGTLKEAIETFKEGHEEVKVLGKTFRCEYVEITDKSDDETFYHKTWSSDEVPGGIVKGIRTLKKGNTTVSESEEMVVNFHKS